MDHDPSETDRGGTFRPDGGPGPTTEDDRSYRVLDPGDGHDKGELSLCVGEAA
jgi:hypothetical protein